MSLQSVINLIKNVNFWEQLKTLMKNHRTSLECHRKTGGRQGGAWPGLSLLRQALSRIQRQQVHSVQSGGAAQLSVPSMHRSRLHADSSLCFVWILSQRRQNQDNIIDSSLCTEDRPDFPRRTKSHLST
jgi:hypothetical protein